MKTFEQFLNELKAKRDFSCLMVEISEPLKGQLLKFQEKVADKDLYTAEEGMGREWDPHITLLYGLHLQDPRKIEAFMKENWHPVFVKLGKISRFSSEDKPYDVLKVDVESEDLVELNKLFRDNFEYTNEYDEYLPHATICYVKKGACKELDGTEIGESEYLDGFIFSNADSKHYDWINGLKKFIPAKI